MPLPDGRYVRVRVEDDGAGIPQKMLPKIFEPYFSTKARGVEKGVGLSLSISYSIVQQHGGHISEDMTLAGTLDVINAVMLENRVSSDIPESKGQARRRRRSGFESRARNHNRKRHKSGPSIVIGGLGIAAAIVVFANYGLIPGSGFIMKPFRFLFSLFQTLLGYTSG